MAYTILSNSGHVAQGIKEYVADTVSDMNALTNITAGSTCKVLSPEEKNYIYSCAGNWVELGG